MATGAGAAQGMALTIELMWTCFRASVITMNDGYGMGMGSEPSNGFGDGHYYGWGKGDGSGGGRGYSDTH